MKFSIAKCPSCGESPSAICETVAVEAILSEPEQDGEQDYIGDTEVYWDTQTAEETPEGVLVVCENRHEWRTKMVEVTE